MRLLDFVKDAGPVPVRYVADTLEAKRSVVSARLRILCEEGLLKRVKMASRASGNRSAWHYSAIDRDVQILGESK